MPTSPRSQLHPEAAVYRKRRRTAFFLLAASVAIYLLALGAGVLRDYQHLHLALVAVQYALLLWVVRLYLRSPRDQITAESRLPLLNLRALIACFALVAIPLSWFSTLGLLNPDESGYSFQARIYRSGRIMADPLIGATTDVKNTPAELFYANHVLRPWGWFPKFPPGWPAVLSLGYLVSARWLPTPLFGLLQLFAIAAIGSRCFSRETGVMAALFAALSPFYLVNSIGMMSHAFCALLAATACLFLFKGLQSGKVHHFAAMFACLAATFQVRPYTGFVITVVVTLAALYFSRSDRRLLARILSVGVFFGFLAMAGVLLSNHAYTGKWLVSPYAEAAGTNSPPELSFNPITIWRGMARYGPYMVIETIFGAFPFLHLLAAYAVVRENRLRREVTVLAAIYVSLVVAYLAHPEGYGVLLGERFHFEAFFAVVILAARGLQLLTERWQTDGTALVSALFLVSALQLGQQGACIHTVWQIGEPYRKVRAAVSRPDVSGLVFLHDSGALVAKHFNLNEADWRHAPRLFLVDAQPDRRPEWACRYGFSRWSVVTYDARTHDAVLSQEKTDCEAATTTP